MYIDAIFAFYGYVDIFLTHLYCLVGCLSMMFGHMLFWVYYMHVFFFTCTCSAQLSMFSIIIIIIINSVINSCLGMCIHKYVCMCVCVNRFVHILFMFTTFITTCMWCY